MTFSLRMNCSCATIKAAMKEISIQELQNDVAQWVRMAARKEQIVITDAGQPVAALIAFDEAHPPKHLPDREAKIVERSLIKTDSADYISEMRG